MSVQWKSIDPITQKEVDYIPADNAAIEASFQKNPNGQHQLNINGLKFLIDFQKKQQINAKGNYRHVRRCIVQGPVRFSKPPVNAAKSVEEMIVFIIDNHLTMEIVLNALVCINQMENICSCINENLKIFRHAFSSEFHSESDLSLEMIFSSRFSSTSIESIMNIIIELMLVPGISSSLCNEANDRDYAESLARADIGSPVPSYFANVVNEGMFTRKVLSVLGLRNLLVKGPEIFQELQWQLFSSNPACYTSSEGPGKMKCYTGNVVDLDTVILNCNSQLKEINAMRIKENKQPFQTANDFFMHPDTKKMAISQAIPLIDVFVEQLNLDANERLKRRLVPDKDNHIPTALTNRDRGTHAIWGYNNAGVLTYHVNAPHLPDISGAILQAPYQMCKGFLLMLAACGVLPSLDEMNTMIRNKEECKKPIKVDNKSLKKILSEIDAFYSSVSDSCFNAKWKSIEMYIDKMASVDDIDVVLSKIQSENQHIFNAAFFNSDDDARTNEKNEMCKIINQNNIKGRDPIAKIFRPISAEDVDKWISKTNL